MTLVAEALIALVILVGAFFLLVGSIGLAKLPDLMRRLHGPSKASTLGIGALLVASMLYFALLQGDPSFHEILITLFLFITAPISAQMIAKVHLLAERRAGRRNLPETGRPVDWATFDPAPADEAAGSDRRQAETRAADLASPS
jgi:multicomponent K+:H+ antiporter subunit G